MMIAKEYSSSTGQSRVTKNWLHVDTFSAVLIYKHIIQVKYHLRFVTRGFANYLTTINQEC